MLKGLKRWLRNYFGFTRNQTNGFLLLIPSMLLILFSEPLFERLKFRNASVHLEEQKIIDSAIVAWETKLLDNNHDAEHKPFPFDPNTANQGDLEALGFQPFVAKRIIHYREKGGRFVLKSDLLKIYGIDSNLVKGLYPHILLPDQLAREVKPLKTSPEPIPRFDLNEADSTQFTSVSGIGPVLSQRILKYRSSLGGFTEMNQLYEVWGLDTAVVEQLKIAAFLSEDFVPGQINVNTADEIELSRHPYISKKMARAIVTYRFQHGSFDDIRDLEKIERLDQAALKKAWPYLSVK